MKSPLFYAKILLFGEYGIIEKANGLTLPYNSFKGLLHKHSETDSLKKSNKILKEFTIYLEEKLPNDFDFNTLNEDLSKGLSFDSDIPQGYGVGSSGALVAALYDKYALSSINIDKRFDKEKIAHLKAIFAKMESYFHGKSSGIDPLICYLNIPLLIKSDTDISHIGLPKTENEKGAIFLLNSGSPGETEPMIEIFFDKLKNKGFRKTLKEEFIKYNNASINAFVKGDFKRMIREMKHLSSWALEHFRPMIPNKMVDTWQKGIDTNLYYLKLCGSGGGGYLLGFTKDYEKAKEHFQKHDPEIILRF